ncbi:OmpH family outer membrane protein [Salidesulfovibrio brasiliensis]|uniref:OmpH family outer membrane protein n=1 Tax=Salidesulfovibrio brasiliensis TaxID=221711 RepID=UPI0006D200A5|nr:OmpH family outer membrane protein [Salidesulfovibrio brasiliensis]
MKKMLLALCVIHVLVLIPNYVSAKIGWVDVSVVLKESKIGKVTFNDIARLQKVKEINISQKKDELSKIKKMISSKLYDKDTIKTTFYKKIEEYKLLVESSEKDLEVEKRLMFKKIIEIINKKLVILAQEANVDAIIFKPENGYFSAELDLTDRLIELLDEGSYEK